VSNHPTYMLSLSDLLTERDALQELEQRVDRELEKRVSERDVELRKRLDAFRITDEIRQLFITKLRQAFSRREGELMLVSFASELCSDGGRAIASAPPSAEERESYPSNTRPAWFATLPAGVLSLYEFWEESLKQGGFGFEARILCYPEGRTGDVGLFITWPRNASRLMH
jgi:hypothetical protein